MPKQAQYKELFDQMWGKNKALMFQFKFLNDDFSDLKKRKKINEEFQLVWKKVQSIVQEYVEKLCGRVERGQYSFNSSNLEDKFLTEVRKYFKYYDYIGLEIKN